MKVARITDSNDNVFITNDVTDESLAKLRQERPVKSLDIIDMTPEDFWRTPATIEAAEFFGVLTASA